MYLKLIPIERNVSFLFEYCVKLEPANSVVKFLYLLNGSINLIPSDPLLFLKSFLSPKLIIEKLSVVPCRLLTIAKDTEKNILKSVSLFDVYEGDKLPEGKKSYALSFILEDKTKTLTDKYIDKVMSKLISSYENKVGAEVRSK